jgi:8-amino-7-oxononanoate synthase
MPKDILSSHHCFSKYPEYKKLKRRFRIVDELGASNPFLREGTIPPACQRQSYEKCGPEYIRIGEHLLLNFSSFDYLGLANDEDVIEGAAAAAKEYGTSASASRLSGGERPIHRLLERELSEFLGTEDCCALVSGHATNETTIGSLMGRKDLILYDELSHNSILQGCKLSGAKYLPFAHNNWNDLGSDLRELRDQYRRVLVIIEGVYSMDGDIPEVPQFAELCKRYKAHLMIDEAHSLGTVGKTGRGVLEHWDMQASDVDILMGTMSKALGSCGGYIAGSKELIFLVKHTVPSFVFSVGMAPPAAGAALEALRMLRDSSWRVQRLQSNASMLRKMLTDNVNAAKSPIIPVITGNSRSAIQLSQQLFEKHINVNPIVFPAVPEKSSRLRFFVTCEHTPQQLEETVIAVQCSQGEEPCEVT